MRWVQLTDPRHNMFLSALIAALPVFFIFWALIIRRMKGYKASLYTALVALIAAIAGYGMPVQLAVLSALHGALYAVFPICWIIFSALFLFNITVRSGRFEIIKSYLASVTFDRRLQVLLIAFSFGSFLEGSAGFATPVVITAAMLSSLGFDPFYAAGICLIANTAPVAFGSMGIPIVVASNVSGISEFGISQMVGRTLPFVSFFLPFYMISVTSGFRKAAEIWPACLVSGLSFAFFQWFCSNYIGPSLPDIIAGIASIACLMVLLRFWKPRAIWRFKEERAVAEQVTVKHSSREILEALLPFILMTLFAVSWNIPVIRSFLDSIGTIQIPVAGLHNRIIQEDGQPLPQIFKLNLLSISGTAIFFAGLIAFPLLKLSVKEAAKILAETFIQLKYPVITISSVLAFAYVSNCSGMSATLAKVFTNTGFLFPFFAPVLGWLGVFITGSDTSANALFCKLQYKTASLTGLNPVITVAANCSGGVVGKMISPQSVAIAATAGGLTGKESKLFRFTIKHSFILLFVICVLVFLQAYVFRWIVP